MDTRFALLRGSRISDDRNAAQIAWDDADGNAHTLEITRDMWPLFIDQALAISAALSPPPGQPEGPPGDGTRRVIPLPGVDLHMVSKSDGSIELIARTGLVDLSLSMPRPAAKALGSALTEATKSKSK